MEKRTPPKKLAKKIVKLMQKELIDPNYVKKVFSNVRSLLNIHGGSSSNRKLPELLTENELVNFYNVVLNNKNSIHIVMIKILIYTGIRNSELSNIKLKDVDLTNLKIRIQNGKGNKDRYVPISPSFQSDLTLYINDYIKVNKEYLFETNRKSKFSTRWIREIIKIYANKAGIQKRIYPHLFRHQLLTYLTDKNLVDAKIQLLSGHSDRKSLAMYQDLSLVNIEEDYRNAMKDFPVK